VLYYKVLVDRWSDLCCVDRECVLLSCKVWVDRECDLLSCTIRVDKEFHLCCIMK